MLTKICGGNQHLYIKDIFGEQWDDYQLRSIGLGGNKQLYLILKEYGIEKSSLCNTIDYSCIQWYKVKHQAKMDNVECNEMKPPVTWGESVSQTQIKLKNVLDIGTGKLMQQ